MSGLSIIALHAMDCVTHQVAKKRMQAQAQAADGDGDAAMVFASVI